MLLQLCSHTAQVHAACAKRAALQVVMLTHMARFAFMQGFLMSIKAEVFDAIGFMVSAWRCDLGPEALWCRNGSCADDQKHACMLKQQQQQ